MVDPIEIVDCYTIAHFECGVGIKGQIPHFMEGIYSHLFYQHFGLDIVDLELAEYLKCETVYTSEPKAIRWKKALGIYKEEEAV